MTELTTATVAARLAAAGVRVGSIWDRDGNHEKTWYDVRKVRTDYVAELTVYHEQRADEVVEIGRYRDPQQAADACQRHYADRVIAMLEPVPSEEPQP